MSSLLDRLRGLLPRSALARSVGVLAGGTALGQAIVVLSSPVLTRIYSPDDLGVLAVYGSILSLLGVVASLRYEQAIPIAEEEREAASTLVLSLALVVVTSLVVLVAALVASRVLPDEGRLSELRPLLWLFPVGVLGVGTYQTLSMWAVRKKAFGRLAGTSWRQGVGGAGTQIGLGLFNFGALGLVVGQIVGQSAGIAALAGLLKPSAGQRFPVIDRRSVAEAAHRFRKFPRFSAWSGLLSVASLSVPVTLMAYIFGPIVTGFYSLGLRALQTPLRTLGNAVSQVFLSATPEAARTGRLAELAAPALKKLIDIGMPAALVISLAGAEISAIVFGADWREAGVYMQWLAPWLLLTMVTSPLAPLFSALERQQWGLFFNALFLVGRCLALILGGYFGGPQAAIAAFGVLSFVMQGAMLLWLSSAAGVAPRAALAMIGTAFIRNAPLMLPLLVIPYLASDPLSGLLMLLYGGVALAVGVLLTVRYRS